jgi:hypothetical protein
MLSWSSTPPLRRSTIWSRFFWSSTRSISVSRAPGHGEPARNNFMAGSTRQTLHAAGIIERGTCPTVEPDGDPPPRNRRRGSAAPPSLAAAVLESAGLPVGARVPADVAVSITQSAVPAWRLCSSGGWRKGVPIP